MKASVAGLRGTRAATAVGLAAAAGLGCKTPMDPQDVLAADVVIVPASVMAGDSLTVTLTITNPTRLPVRLTSGSTCVALPQVFSAEGNRMSWDGTGLGCFAAVSTFIVPARRTLEWQFRLVALLPEAGTSPDFVVPPPPGRYRMVMQMHVNLPDIERHFVVEE